MTHRQILEKAMLKAHKNGWQPLSTIPWKNVKIEQWQGHGMVGIALLYGDGKTDVQWVRELEGIIFNHDFAKALWGEGKKIGTLPSPKTNGQMFDSEYEYHISTKGWKYFLQQMVVADDPIKYLGANL